jgi:hypothetical protein
MLIWLSVVFLSTSVISIRKTTLVNDDIVFVKASCHAVRVYREVYYTTCTGLIDNRKNRLYAACVAREVVYHVTRLYMTFLVSAMPAVPPRVAAPQQQQLLMLPAKLSVLVGRSFITCVRLSLLD